MKNWGFRRTQVSRLREGGPRTGKICGADDPYPGAPAAEAQAEGRTPRLSVRGIIDSHCHIYPDKIAPRVMEAIESFYQKLPAAHCDGTVGTLLAGSRANGIRHAIVQSVATKPEQVHSINAFIASAVAAHPGEFTGFGSLHPDSADPEGDLAGLLALGLRGVKLHPDTQHFRADSPAAMRIFGLCEEMDVPVLVHTGDFRYDYSNPERIAGVLRVFPRLRFTGAHFGGWSVWEDAVRFLPDFPNFAVDTSSSFFWLAPERAAELIRIFGSERVMFGTDYPFWRPEPELEYLARLPLEREELEDICWRTACRRYGIAEDDVLPERAGA